MAGHTSETRIAPIPLVESATDRVRWRVTAEWEEHLLGPQGLRLDEWLSDGRVQIVKHGSHRTVYRVDLPHRSFFLKHYRVLAFLNAATHLLRGSAAWREWRNAFEVRRRRVPTVTPIALGEHYRAGLIRDSYFVSEAIPDSCTLEYYTDECLPKLARSEQVHIRWRICRALAQLCAAAHRSGVYHTDFHRGNVLIGLHTIADGRLPELHLIDLPKMWFSQPLSWPHSRDSLAMFAAAWLDRSSDLSGGASGRPIWPVGPSCSWLIPARPPKRLSAAAASMRGAFFATATSDRCAPTAITIACARRPASATP